METTTANLNNTNTNTNNAAANQPNFVTAALSAFNSINGINNNSFNHNNAAMAASLLARLSANRHLNNLNNLNSINNSTSTTSSSSTNGNAMNNPLNNPFSSGHFVNLAATAAAITHPYSLQSTYADFYHNFNLLNQQQQQQSIDTTTPTNGNSPVNGNGQNNQTATSLINSQCTNGLYSIDNLLSPSMLNSANLIAQQFAKNTSLETALRAAENGLKKKGGLCDF